MVMKCLVGVGVGVHRVYITQTLREVNRRRPRLLLHWLPMRMPLLDVNVHVRVMLILGLRDVDVVAKNRGVGLSTPVARSKLHY